jgi:CRISPR-associated endonuclease/helicase Cas3
MWLSAALGLKAEESPFPWQLTLLESFRSGKLWPALDLPTGLGKTSVMAIWLVARAMGALLPRRIVYVVDRRAVVDQATEVALCLREFVEHTPEVKEQLGLSGRSLPVSTLRGQYVDNREWLDDPAAPAIIVGTVDMVGSRLLLQGYGVSRKMRPYHAGLLGADTLAVLDEAHLVPAFEELLRDVANGVHVFGPKNEELQSVVPPFKLMSLSATGRGGTTLAAFRLGEKDVDHPIVKQRLIAPKRLRVRDVKRDDKLAEVLAAEAWELANNGKRPIRCIVFCDKREDAVRAKQEIERLARGDKRKGTEAVEICADLFVGGRRVFERQDAAQRLGSLGFLAGKPVQRGRTAFLFATSAAEVGVDLDADCMVCDLVTWERMVQRLGRVNRRGDAPGGADVAVVVEPEPEADKRTREALARKPEERDDKEKRTVEKYEAAVAERRAKRKALDVLCRHDGVADASLAALRDLNERAEKVPELRRILEAATTPVPLRPALTRAVLESWSMTSLESYTGRPDIEPWLRGWIENDPPQTEIVWRAYLPVRAGWEGKKPGARQEVEAFFEAAPPHTSEALETETFRVVEWLAARARALVRDSNSTDRAANSGLGGRDVAAVVLSKGGKLQRVLRVGEFDTDKEERKKLRKVLANATLITDARIAGLKEGLLDDTEATLPRTVDDGQPWVPVAGFRVRVADAGESVPRDPQWRERLRFAAEVSDEGEPLRWLLVEKRRGDSANEEDRSAGSPQLLQEHRAWAENSARALAKELALRPEYEEMLCTAAFLHDEGKRAERWQRAFNAPDGDDVYAKTEGPINYALLGHYRHELGSILAIEGHERLQPLSESLRDLALHLIAAHHGFARPFTETRGCDGAPPSVLDAHARGIALRFARLQQCWGPWGLAWWEALLRSVDQQASRENDARTSQPVPAVRTGGA